MIEPFEHDTKRGASRRSVLLGLTALASGLALPTRSGAQDADVAQEGFSFDTLSAAMKARAGERYAEPETAEGFVGDLTYSQYRHIAFRPDRARWADGESPFRLQAFHLGWLFEQPVPVREVVNGAVQPFSFTADDFFYHGETENLVEDGATLPGVSGFRVNFPLNRADRFDEVVAFQGASYFRALGRGNAYGLSARGLAINTAMDGGEEFPRFSAFYLERPAPGARSVTVYAELDSESVTGAYRFVITPGRETAVDVTARLFFRDDVRHLGVAPLTSMFLYAEGNRSRFDDYRPQVHDSNGLQVRRANGDILWRALANPPRLGTSYFAETSPTGFGLHQRDRRFDEYQDAEARYEDRPSVDVDLLGDWGEGAVRLVEIPSDLEVNDNIVAYWVPRDGFAAGDEREYAYRLRWGMLAPDPEGDKAYVFETRTGVGGASGVSNEDGSRKFVVDFRGGRLGQLDPDAEVEGKLSVNRGDVVSLTLHKLSGTDIWRFVADVVPEPNATMELVAFIEGYGDKLSETWLYQWIDA
nr:glucan biosynthesis protein G [Roseitranquillus sediminis]